MPEPTIDERIAAVDAAIAQAALEPLSTTNDGQSATNRSVDELLKVKASLTAEKAAAARGPGGQPRSPWRGILTGVARTPGAG